MVKNKMVNRLVSLLCALFLLASSVLVSYQTAYASVSITEAGSYFLRMLCSAAGLYFEHSEVGLVVDVLSQVAAQSDTINSKEFKERMDYVLSLSPSDRIDETFSNAFLSDLINGFRESTINEDGHGGAGLSFSIKSDYSPLFSGEYSFGDSSCWENISLSDVASPVYVYIYQYGSGSLNTCIRFISESPFNVLRYSASLFSDRFYSFGFTKKIGDSYVSLLSDSKVICIPDLMTTSDFDSYIKSDGFVLGEVPSKVVTVPVGNVWVDAFDDAALHAPAITAPISIPADTAAMEENAKAVAAADNVDALYKALAAAGIAIGVDVDVPDETDKSTDAEIPDDGSSAIGKQLSAIYEGILGIADKVGSIPAQIENFFTIDTDAIGDAFMGLKDAFSSRFDAILKVADMFTNLSPKLDSSVPLISIRIPQSLQPIYNAEEVVVFDLRGFEDTCKLVRLFFRALLWFGFGYVVLREFDVKFHVS